MIAFQSFSYESLVVYALRQKGATTDTTGGVPCLQAEKTPYRTTRQPFLSVLIRLVDLSSRTKSSENGLH